jgi:hypothetical protein
MWDVTTDPTMPQPSAGPKRRPRLLVTLTAVWALVVAGLGVYAARRGAPTVRAQTSVAHALPTVDRAIAEVDLAAERSGAVVEISGYEAVDSPCTITAAREGGRYTRVASLYVPEGREAALLDAVGAKLPRAYGPHVSKDDDHPLTADAGDYVAVRGSVVGPGRVHVTADTECRPLTGAVHESRPASSDANRKPVEAVLAVLGIRQPRWQTHRVACPAGGSLWTVQADGPPGSAPASLADKLRGASATALLARPDVYAYRSGPLGLVARTHDGIVTVTATTGCPQ